MATSDITTVTFGDPDTFEYRVYFQKGSQQISAFHDVPLKTEDCYNFICEIPKGTNAKLEISKEDEYNPIKQDIKKGKLRYISYGNYPFHYGAFPQTWEDPNHVFPGLGYPGDNDPLDVCEIGSGEFVTGQIVPVKVLGCLAMIDDDETDWKVITISSQDPLFDAINDIDDVDKHMPGKLDQIREWFRLYKTSEGKPPNKFGMDEQYQDRKYAEALIEDTNKLWKNLVAGKVDPKGVNTKRGDAPSAN